MNTMNKTNINRFLDHESKMVDKKKCTDRIIAIWLLNIFFYFVGLNPIYAGICISIMNIVISRCLLNLMNKFDNIEYRLLFNGIFYFYLSCLMVLMSYQVLNMFNPKILCCYFLFHLIVTSVLWCVLFFIVNYGRFKSKESRNKLHPYTGALMGFLLTRFIFEELEMSHCELQIFTSVFLFLVAIAISYNNFDLLKIILRKVLTRMNTEDGSLS